MVEMRAGMQKTAREIQPVAKDSVVSREKPIRRGKRKAPADAKVF